MEPSAHLLRTLAAVAPGARIVDVSCGDGRHLAPLAQLGFDVWGVTTSDPTTARARLADVMGDDESRQRVSIGGVARVPDGQADWVVLVLDGLDVAEALADAARVLQPGGWVWVETALDATEGLDAAAQGAGLVASETMRQEHGRVHVIFRRPGAVG